jgi:hypothetical protein
VSAASAVISGVGAGVAAVAASVVLLVAGYHAGERHQAIVDAQSGRVHVITPGGNLDCIGATALPGVNYPVGPVVKTFPAPPPPDCVPGHGCRPFPGLVLPVCNKAKDVCCKAGDAACIKELPKP